MKPSSPLTGRIVLACAALPVVLGCPSQVGAQLLNPLPLVEESGITIALNPWLTIPPSKNVAPFTRIAHLKPCPDGVRLFCNDQRGEFWVIADNQTRRPTLFVNLEWEIPSFVDSPGIGSGFSSFDFHPEFATPGAPGYGKFYTSHTESLVGSPPADFSAPSNQRAAIHGVISEWTMDDHADAFLSRALGNFTRRELLRINFPFTVHGIQEVAFDPNAGPGDDNYGCLFAAVGEGGAGGSDAQESAGRIDSILGTIIRILPVLSTGQQAGDYLESENGEYLIPMSNPFANSADPTPEDGIGPVKEVYAYGFRNPHRISWDTGGSGKLFCGNIGEKNIEEVELVEPGQHYGWPGREGSFLIDYDDPEFVLPLPDPDTAPPNGPPEPANYSYPVAQFDHDDGRAIVGGYVYRGSDVPELEGMYVCGGIARGRIFVAPESDLVLQPPTPAGEAPAALQSVALHFNGAITTFRDIIGPDFDRVDLRFGIDHGGELYLLSKRNGRIYRVTSVPRFEFVPPTDIVFTPNPDTITLTFPTEIGKLYRLWSSDALQFWGLTNLTVSGTGNPEQLIDTDVVARKFYIIEATPDE